VPTLPEPFARISFSEDDVKDAYGKTDTAMIAKFRKVKHQTLFTPPSKEGSWIFPGFDGGGEWGGSAVDIKTGILYVNSSELPWIQLMIDAAKKNENDQSLKGLGSFVSAKYCISCHGPDLKGNGVSIPSLTQLETKYNEVQLRKLIENGKNMMPAIRTIPDAEMNALLTFLLKTPEKEPGSREIKSVAEKNNLPGTKEDHVPAVPYIMAGYTRFINKEGMPGIVPPWGTLNAVDLNSGKLLWKIPLGEYPELAKKGIAPTGTENYGGPLVTAGGLVFIAATKDEKIRAFDKKTGKQLWEAILPAAGFATPATYMADGKQYVVIACGGGKVGNRSGDSYVAFALE
jgi:quinoprotein glucose dehydrogenase